MIIGLAIRTELIQLDLFCRLVEHVVDLFSKPHEKGYLEFICLI
jgi:hypothetical protein